MTIKGYCECDRRSYNVIDGIQQVLDDEPLARYGSTEALLEDAMEIILTYKSICQEIIGNKQLKEMF